MNRLAPFSKLLGFLVCGILLARFLQTETIHLIIVACCAVVFSLVLNHKYYSFSKPIRVFLFQLGIFVATSCIGIVLSQNKRIAVPSEFYSAQSIEAVAEIERIESTPEGKKLFLKTFQVRAADSLYSTEIGLVCKTDTNFIAEAFDKLFIEGRHEPFFANLNPGAFNYAKYMETNGYYFEVYPNKIVKFESGGFSVFKLAADIRRNLEKVLARNLEARELGVAEALVLGQKHLLEKETKEAFSGVGAMHILAVSGLHVGLVFLLFNVLFAPVKRIRFGRTIHTVLIILMIVSYAAITGFSPSVTRASLMFILISLGLVLNRMGNTFNTIFASAFLMLLYNPNYLYDVGFQLSYTAVIGIVYLYPKLFALHEPKSWLGLKLWSLLCLALAAQLATFPLGLYYFHQFPTYFFITNLIVIPAAFVLLLGGFVLFFSALFSEWIPQFESVLGKLYHWIVFGLNELVELLFQLPFSTIGGIEISSIQLLLIYICILFIVAMLVWQYRWLVYATLHCFLMLVLSFSYSTYRVHSTSGVLVYQNRNFSFEVFEGEKSIFYSSDTSAIRKDRAERRIADYNRFTGRETRQRISSERIPKKVQFVKNECVGCTSSISVLGDSIVITGKEEGILELEHGIQPMVIELE